MKMQLTDGERQYIEAVIGRCGGRRAFRAKMCWKNASLLMDHDDARRLRYCEGYLDGIPHAWVTINGKVVDVTAEAVVRKLRRMKTVPDRTRTYNSVLSADRRMLARHIVETREYARLCLRVISTRATRERRGAMEGVGSPILQLHGQGSTRAFSSFFARGAGFSRPLSKFSSERCGFLALCSPSQRLLRTIPAAHNHKLAPRSLREFGFQS